MGYPQPLHIHLTRQHRILSQLWIPLKLHLSTCYPSYCTWGLTCVIFITHMDGFHGWHIGMLIGLIYASLFCLEIMHFGWPFWWLWILLLHLGDACDATSWFSGSYGGLSYCIVISSWLHLMLRWIMMTLSLVLWYDWLSSCLWITLLDDGATFLLHGNCMDWWYMTLMEECFRNWDVYHDLMMILDKIDKRLHGAPTLLPHALHEN
jgi:hypothetical protein